MTRVKKSIDAAERTIANAQGELSEAKKAKDDNRMKKAPAVIEETQSPDGSRPGASGNGMTQYYEVEEGPQSRSSDA